MNEKLPEIKSVECPRCHHVWWTRQGKFDGMVNCGVCHYRFRGTKIEYSTLATELEKIRMEGDDIDGCHE